MNASKMPVAAAILAAGQGRRLGHRPKAALEIGGVSLMEGLVVALRGAGVVKVSAVVGAYPETMVPLAKQVGLKVLLHESANSSLLDSQRLALTNHLERHSGHDLMLLVADLPWLAADDIRAVLGAWRARPSAIQALMPMVDGVRGHPVMLSSTVAEQILASPAHQGVRDWFGEHPQLVQPFVTSRRACVQDIDSPEDVANLRARLVPTPVCWPEPWGDDGIQPCEASTAANT